MKRNRALAVISIVSAILTLLIVVIVINFPVTSISLFIIGATIWVFHKILTAMSNYRKYYK